MIKIIQPSVGGSARFLFSTTNANGSVDTGISNGFSSITKSATGIYDYVFVSPMSYAPCVVVTCVGSYSRFFISASSTTGFSVTFTNTLGAALDSKHMVHVNGF